MCTYSTCVCRMLYEDCVSRSSVCVTILTCIVCSCVVRMLYEDFMQHYGILLRADSSKPLPLRDVTQQYSNHSNLSNTDAHSSNAVTSRATRQLRFDANVICYGPDDVVARKDEVLHSNGTHGVNCDSAAAAALPSNLAHTNNQNSTHTNQHNAPSNRPVVHSNSYAHGDSEHSAAENLLDGDDPVNALYYKQLNITPRRHSTPPNKRRLRRRSCESTSTDVALVCC